MCIDEDLSDKEDYPTFARTEPIGRQLTPAVQELLAHFKWTKFALIVENSTMYQKAYENIQKQFGSAVLDVEYMPTPAKYSHDEHYEKARRDMKNLKDKARSKLYFLNLIAPPTVNIITPLPASCHSALCVMIFI